MRGTRLPPSKASAALLKPQAAAIVRRNAGLQILHFSHENPPGIPVGVNDGVLAAISECCPLLTDVDLAGAEASCFPSDSPSVENGTALGGPSSLEEPSKWAGPSSPEVSSPMPAPVGAWHQPPPPAQTVQEILGWAPLQTMQTWA